MTRSIKSIGKFAAMCLLLTGCNMMQKKSEMPKLPTDAMVIRHTVSDYEKWKPLYDADAPFRQAAGLQASCVARGIENPNDIEIPMMVGDLAKARAFVADPRLKEVMTKGGVTGSPNIKFIRVLRMEDQGKCDYIEVVSKVKDFDAWLKVFDSEGLAVRKKDGLSDMVLGQGIDDPNLVYLVFKINSVAEAKAAFENPARRKLMEQAGVGETTLYFGRDQ